LAWLEDYLWAWPGTLVVCVLALFFCLASGFPASLRNIPDKYNIIIRLWTNCFYRLLEKVRTCGTLLSSKIVLEYLQEFIYYVYTFYTALLERNMFLDYRAGWLEALGDLARYRIVIAAMVPLHPMVRLL
jgi:hypothetical protein